MSYPPDQPGGSYPPRDMRDPNDSQYPPPPGEEDDRARAYHQRAPPTSGVTLPPMSQSLPAYDQQYGPPPSGYQPDPRYRPDPYRDTQQGGYGRDERAYQSDYGRGGPPQMSFQQSAPRQRTAIACRYCRRRKIRCSGFEQSADGRCINCQRFQQECIFTPVSSQAQAFVPAHAVYPHMRNMGVGADGRPRPMMYPPGQQVYGAHGQPLGQVPPPHGGSPYTEYHAPSPTGSYNSFTEERGEPSRKRPQAEPHPAILPPPVPGQPAYREEGTSRRPPVQDEFRLPPVTPTAGPPSQRNYSPGSSTSPAPGLRPPPDSVSNSSRTPPPRSSPGDRADPMSLGNIMEQGPATDIDRNMLGRLNRQS